MNLRPYQRQFVDDIMAGFQVRRSRRVLGVLPTAGGKTVVFVKIAAASGARVNVVAHRRELVRQAGAKLRAAGVDHGYVAPGFPRNPFARVQVVSVGCKWPAADLHILDEAHHAVAGQWTRNLEAQPESRVLGVTATPQRLDGRGLGDVFDDLVLGPSVAELTAAGYLTPARVYAPSVGVDFRGLGERAGDFAADEVASLMDRAAITGDAVEHYMDLCPLEPGVAYCASVEHAQHVAEAFGRAGWRAVAVDGKTPAPVRDAALQGLGDTVDIVCSCDLISEGLDVPNLGAVVLLRPTESLTLYMQQVGRGLRTAPGKRELIVLDHAGNALRHGLPDAPREWSLSGVKTKARPPALRQCPQCYAIHNPGPTCPACGHTSTPGNTPGRQVRAKDGTLVELSPEDVRLQSSPLRDLVREARTFDEMQHIADARGYAPGWVHKMMSFKRIRNDARAVAAEDEFA
jgi:superfamily II DNA or RNA helicase